MATLKSTPPVLPMSSVDTAGPGIKVVKQASPASLMQPLTSGTKTAIDHGGKPIQTVHTASAHRKMDALAQAIMEPSNQPHEDGDFLDILRRNALQRKPLFVLKGEVRDPIVGQALIRLHNQERPSTMVLARSDLSTLADLDSDVSEAILANCNVKIFGRVSGEPHAEEPASPQPLLRNLFPAADSLLWVDEVRDPLMAEKILKIATEGEVVVVLREKDV
jgi:hypothetical protein